MRSKWAVAGATFVFIYIFILSYLSQLHTDTPIQFTIAPTVPPNRYAKNTRARAQCSWSDEAKGLCKINLGDDLMVGVITYHGAHDKIKILKQSWLKNYLLGESVFVISDKEDEEEKIIDSGCTDNLEGLSCKTTYLFQTLYDKNPNAKWFLRAMDDTYVHLPHMLEYLSQFDENAPLFIGMRQVISPVNSYQRFEESQGPQYRPNELFYPQGGCGWVISKGFMKRLLTPENLSALDWFYSKYSMIDDLAFGEYAEKHLKIALLSNRGFSHIAWSLGDCPSNRECPTGPRVPSNITFLTVHAREQWKSMPGLHDVFVHGDFTSEFLPSDIKENHNDWALWKMCKCNRNDNNNYNNNYNEDNEHNEDDAHEDNINSDNSENNENNKSNKSKENNKNSEKNENEINIDERRIGENKIVAVT